MNFPPTISLQIKPPNLFFSQCFLHHHQSKLRKIVPNRLFQMSWTPQMNNYILLCYLSSQTFVGPFSQIGSQMWRMEGRNNCCPQNFDAPKSQIVSVIICRWFRTKIERSRKSTEFYSSMIKLVFVFVIFVQETIAKPMIKNFQDSKWSTCSIKIRYNFVVGMCIFELMKSPTNMYKILYFL